MGSSISALWKRTGKDNQRVVPHKEKEDGPDREEHRDKPLRQKSPRGTWWQIFETRETQETRR